MTTLLQLESSIFSGQGNSSHLVQNFVQAWQQRNPDAVLIHRDLSKDPVPHLTAERVQSFFTPESDRTPEQNEVVAFSDTLIDELRRADVIVLGLPMYNFGIPSVLKAYFDHVARAGVTFKYTATGPVGLLGDKQVYIMAARGGAYQGTPKDTQTPYVQDFLNFIGITSIKFVYAEGLNISPEQKQSSLAQAEVQIGQLIG